LGVESGFVGHATKMSEAAFGLLRYQYPASGFLVAQRFDVAGVGDELKKACGASEGRILKVVYMHCQP
jgi:hypothetical protein